MNNILVITTTFILTYGGNFKGTEEKIQSKVKPSIPKLLGSSPSPPLTHTYKHSKIETQVHPNKCRAQTPEPVVLSILAGKFTLNIHDPLCHSITKTASRTSGYFPPLLGLTSLRTTCSIDSSLRSMATDKTIN